jgi:maleylpyruvate isomerase
MSRNHADALRWARDGTELFLAALARAGDDQLAGTTALEGWTGKHVTAHVAANADALRNLVHWARTGEETPMYSSPEQRDADIATGAQRPTAALRAWARTSALALDEDLSTLDDEQWGHEVRTAQGRTVPATEVPWMRAREVMVHAVDLEVGVRFGDLPLDFLAALVDDIVGKRSSEPTGPAVTLKATDTGTTWALPGTSAPAEVTGTLADLTAYLSGRTPHAAVDPDGNPAPHLPRWL